MGISFSFQAEANWPVAIDVNVPMDRGGTTNVIAAGAVRLSAQAHLQTPFLPVGTVITATFNDGYIQVFQVNNSAAGSIAVIAYSHAIHPETGNVLDSNGTVLPPTSSIGGSGGGGVGGFGNGGGGAPGDGDGLWGGGIFVSLVHFGEVCYRDLPDGNGGEYRLQVPCPPDTEA